MAQHSPESDKREPFPAGISPTWPSVKRFAAGRIFPASAVGLLLLGPVLLGLNGCEKAEITRYSVPKDEPPPQAAEPSGSRQRMLAVILPHGGHVWFFKFWGPEKLVIAEATHFLDFILSVRFSDDPAKPVTWTTPAGWQEEGPSGSRQATLRIAADGELSVSALGPEAAAVLPNVNRWRGQLGLGPIDEAELAKSVKQMRLEAGPATLVNIRGPAMPHDTGANEGPAAPPEGAGPNGPPEGAESNGPPVAAGPPADIQYVMPPGWRPNPDPVPGPQPVAAFLVGPSGRTASVTVIPLPGRAGGVEANVIRWRRQVGLEPQETEDLGKSLRKFEVAGKSVVGVSFYGPESAGANRKGLLGAIADNGGYTWFIKMIGPAKVVADAEGSFDKFARSIRFVEPKAAPPMSKSAAE